MAALYAVRIEMVGWRTLVADGIAFAELLPDLTYQATEQIGMITRTSAMTDKPWNDDTYATRRSMNSDPVMFAGGDVIAASMGPTTPYAPLLEYGWSKGGNFYIFPFMIPALDKHTPDFINAMIDVMGIALGERPFTLRQPLSTNALSASIGKARQKLYSLEKALGDVIVITGSRYVGPLRAVLLFGAKELGDIQAVMNSAIGARVSRRITGAVTGRALGYTRTVSTTKVYSGFPGGGSSPSVGGRVYNRVAGRATRPIATGRPFGL